MKGTTTACDACRIRKVGCDRPDGAARCEPCRRSDVECTYTHVRQKPGPPPGYRRKMNAMKAEAAPRRDNAAPYTIPVRLDRPPPPGSVHTYGLHAHPPHPQHVDGVHYPHPAQHTHPPPPPPPLPPAQHHHHQAHQHLPPSTNGASAPYMAAQGSHMSHGSHSASPAIVYGAHNHSGPPTAALTGASGIPTPPTGPKSVGAFGHDTTGITNPLDRVLPRDLLNRLMGIYFEYMFWINPYPHRPTFERDLANRREEEPGQGEFAALVFGMIAFALLLPKCHIPLNAEEIASLGNACFENIMQFLKQEYDTFTHARLFTIHCAAGLSLCNGKVNLCRELIGSHLYLALQRNLDRERTYAAMEPLDREMWRRVWWLLYTTDRSGATCEGARPILNEELCWTVALPSCLNDEHLELASQGLMPFEPDPSDQCPQWGFFYSSAMWRTAGKILTRREQDTTNPPPPDSILKRVAELDEIIEELDDLFIDCPSWLALNLDLDIASPNLPMTMSATTPGNLSPLQHGIGVQQSNLWITQLAIRLVAVQYRKELVDMRWNAPTIGGHASVSTFPIIPAVLPRGNAFRELKLRENEDSFRDDRDHILTTLLRILQALPMEQIAGNSFPGLQKIRYIASTLLSDFDETSQPAADADEASRRSYKALTYLQEYIDYLARLEAMYIERADATA